MNDSSNKQTSSDSRNEHARLPCRGCLKSCKNYQACEGRPWRLPQPEVSGNK